MADLIDRQAAYEVLSDYYHHRTEFQHMALRDALSRVPSAQPERGCIEQIRWERDIAIQQLNELGYGLGEKIRTDGDTISRQAMLDIVSGYAEQFNGYIGSPNDSEVYAYARGLILSIERNINAVPSVQQEREKGKWLPDNNNYYEYRFICSVCGRSYKVDTRMGKPMWDFCPCGADMR